MLKRITQTQPLLQETHFPELGKRHQGKVRDYYILSDKRIIITTDRQSAFDVNLGFIPQKGAVLNQLAAFWFEQTQDILPNHVISVPDSNVTIAHNCEGIPIEMIVRGYITGVTNTSIWGSYEKGEREIYGIHFPDSLKKNQQLPHPVITPTSHGGGADGHDERLTREQILKSNVVNSKIYRQMEQVALALFKRGTEIAKKAGLILVDTKYEFGLYNGKFMLMDEIHTPDSSRFWVANTYQERFAKDEEPDNFDKEFLRLWYAKKGYKGDGPPPPMTEELITQVSNRYIAVYEKLTGNQFIPETGDIQKRIRQNLINAHLLNG